MKNKIGVISTVIMLCFFFSEPLFGEIGFVNVPASAFHQGDENSQATYLVSKEGYVYCPNQSSCLYASIHFPDGVIISRMELYYYDDIQEDFTISMQRVNIFSGEETTLFSFTTSQAFDFPRYGLDSRISPSAAYGKVYNNACQYYISVCLPRGSDARIYGVYIEYLF